MRRAFAMLVLTIMVPASSFGQDPPQPPAEPSEHERLSEEFIQSRAVNGESHASGARPELGPVIRGNPTQAVVALRVGLHFTTLSSSGGIVSEFNSLHHPYVEVTNTEGDVKILDRATGRAIAVMTAGSLVRVEHDGTSFLVSQDAIFLGTFEGPVFFRPNSRGNLFRIEHIRRSFSGVKVPLYRGAIEVARGRITAGLTGPPRVNLVNIVELEDYVPGVVANESIASFAVEALKAQATAARGYAVANIGNYVARGYPFDIVDSSASQVYRGVVSEHVNAVRAASETVGLVASSNGNILTAFYSSSFGGHSENNEWIFNAPSTVWPGANPLPYLRGIYDGADPAPDFSNIFGIDAFWRTNPMPQMYDDCAWTGNTFSRWKFPLSPATIKARLTNANSVMISGARTGTIADIEITQRMAASARAGIVRITFVDPPGVYEVRGWDNLRAVLGRTANAGNPRACGSSTIPINFTLNNPSSIDVARNLDGTVSGVTVYGGGWGHNLGMSQYGAHGRGKAGQNFIQILKGYYTGADIGSYPIDIGRDPGTGPPPLRQRFYAPNALGVLEIRATDLAGLRVHINDQYDLSFDEAALASGLVQVDVSEYLVTGINMIQYNPVGRSGSATVSVVVR